MTIERSPEAARARELRSCTTLVALLACAAFLSFAFWERRQLRAGIEEARQRLTAHQVYVGGPDFSDPLGPSFESWFADYRQHRDSWRALSDENMESGRSDGLALARALRDGGFVHNWASRLAGWEKPRGFPKSLWDLFSLVNDLGDAIERELHRFDPRSAVATTADMSALVRVVREGLLQDAMVAVVGLNVVEIHWSKFLDDVALGAATGAGPALDVETAVELLDVLERVDPVEFVLGTIRRDGALGLAVMEASMAQAGGGGFGEFLLADRARLLRAVYTSWADTCDALTVSTQSERAAALAAIAERSYSMSGTGEFDFYFPDLSGPLSSAESTKARIEALRARLAAIAGR